MDNKSPEAFRTISEVAEWLGVPTHVLRFWESRFGQVKPVKRAGGRRYYRPSDMELLGGIRKLLHDDGMTIRGVQKLLREKGVKHVAALSPPIDQPADMKTVDDVAVFESGEIAPPPSTAQAPVFETAVEDAELVEDEATPDDGPRFDAAPEPVEDGAVDAENAGPRFDTSEEIARTEAAEEPGVFAAETEAPPAPEDSSTLFAPEAETPAGSAETEVAGSEVDGGEAAEREDLSRPDPTEIEFLSHGAAPESREGDAADAAGPSAEPQVTAAARQLVWEEVPEDEVAADAFSTAPTAAADAQAPAGDEAVPGKDAEATNLAALSRDDTTQTDVPDPAAAGGPTPATAPVPVAADEAKAPAPEPGPDGVLALGPELAVTAPGAEPADLGPEDHDPPLPPDGAELPDGAVADGSTMAAPAVDLEPEPVVEAVPEPPEPAAPVLTMPDIGPDPDDDVELELPPALPGRLRHYRADGAGHGLNIAAIRAYADRLEALSQRVGLAPDERRPF